MPTSGKKHRWATFDKIKHHPQNLEIPIWSAIYATQNFNISYITSCSTVIAVSWSHNLHLHGKACITYKPEESVFKLNLPPLPHFEEFKAEANHLLVYGNDICIPFYVWREYIEVTRW